jgi:hypothetical protein
MSTGKNIALLSFDEALNAMSAPAKEAMTERSYALAIGGKANYSDAFEETPKEFRNSIVRRFNLWFASLSPQEQRNFLMLCNADRFAPGFVDYLCNQGGKLEGLSDFAEKQPDVFLKEIRLFLAMHSYDKKIDEAKNGVLAFFSSDGQRFAMLRAFSRQGREFVHEAMGRARKYECDSGDDQEKAVAGILQTLLAEFFGQLFKTLSLTALSEPFNGGTGDSIDAAACLDGDEKGVGIVDIPATLAVGKSA